MGEAFLASARVALEGALAFALGAAALRELAAPRLRAPFAAALALGAVIGAAAFAAARARGLVSGDLAPMLERVRHLHALGLLVAGAALRRRALRGPERPGGAAEAVLLAAGLLALAPESAALGGVLSDRAVLAGSPGVVAAAALGGAAAAAAVGLGVTIMLSYPLARAALTPSSLLFLLFGLEMAGPAAAGADMPPLAPALAGAVGRAIHDGLHVLFVILQVPDHPYLRDEAYQLILLALDPTLHALAAGLALSAPAAAAWLAFRRRPPPELPPGTRPPDRRAAGAAFRRRGRLVGGAFALALALTWAPVWAARGSAEDLYDPIPEPAVEDGQGNVLAPLSTPFGAGRDGRMRKFVWSEGGRAITFLLVRRSDGSLAAALDLCEICQPKGYAQMGRGYVFCKYCKTPIPADTVGQPGGCNPVPLPEAAVKGSLLVVPRTALLAAWEKGLKVLR